MRSKWFIKLITPNASEAQALYQFLLTKGYHSHFKQGGNLVEITKRGPNKCLFVVRTRYKVSPDER